MENFVYLIIEEKSKEAMVVDSGWETKPIEMAAEESGAKVIYAVATHEHFDHVSTIGGLAKKFGARVVAHVNSPIQCDLRVRDNDELKLGGESLRFLHTPGHTEDSICIYDGNEVFTGDTLFIGTIGRFDRVRAQEMYTSLHKVILGLPPSTILYPGHDYGEVAYRTLEEEKASNPFLGSPDLRSFLSLFS